jgi:hypothetical protein
LILLPNNAWHIVCLEIKQNELLGDAAIAATFNLAYHPIQVVSRTIIPSTSQIRNEYAESENNICGRATCFGGEVCSKSFRLVGYIDRVYSIRWITLKRLKWRDPDGKEVSE